MTEETGNRIATALERIAAALECQNATVSVTASPIGVPETRPPALRRPAVGTAPRQEATPRQMKYLHAVAREVGLSPDDLETRAQEEFGESLANISRRDVSVLIERIQSERAVSGIAS